MVLPVFPNAISTNEMNVELTRVGSTTLTMNEEVVRDMLAGNTPNPNAAPYLNLSQISFSDGHGKTAPFRASVTSNTNDLNVRNFLIGQGWDQTKRVVLTINSGVVISTSSASSSSYAVTVSGSFPNGLRIVNNGTIIGRGGPGGIGGGRFNTTVATLSGTAGGTAGRAIFADTNVVIVNNGTIAGGGGGGGGGAGAYGIYLGKRAWCGAGGGGGGAGSGSSGAGGLNAADSGVVSIGNSGGNGSTGGITTGGSGGTAGNITAGYNSVGVLVVAAQQNSGGSGGSSGSSGSSGNNINSVGGQQVVVGSGGSGGSAGLAIKGSNFVTFWVTGSVLGGTETV